MVKIVTDSDANLPPDIVAANDIHVVPIQVHIDGKNYNEGVDLDSQQFLEMLETAQTHPTTSQPSSGQFYATYWPMVSTGHSVVSIHVSGALSGTVGSAQASLELLPGSDVHVIDSRSISMGQGLIVLQAVRLAQAGYRASEIVQALVPMIEGMEVYFTLETLEYLRRSGRVGGAAHLLGSLLHVRPILAVRQGAIVSVGRQRSRAKALDRLRDMALERGRARAGVYLAVGHVGAPDEAQALFDDLSAAVRPVESALCEIGPGISVHCGPGAVGFALYAPG